MQVLNVTKQTVIAEKTVVADTFSTRTRGLLGRKEFHLGEGLLITQCKQIHMFFMPFPIDLVFITKNRECVAIRENIKPWRISRYIAKACDVLELPCGSIEKSKTQPGDILCFKD